MKYMEMYVEYVILFTNYSKLNTLKKQHVCVLTKYIDNKQIKSKV